MLVVHSRCLLPATLGCAVCSVALVCDWRHCRQGMLHMTFFDNTIAYSDDLCACEHLISRISVITDVISACILVYGRSSFTTPFTATVRAEHFYNSAQRSVPDARSLLRAVVFAGRRRTLDICRLTRVTCSVVLWLQNRRPRRLMNSYFGLCHLQNSAMRNATHERGRTSRGITDACHLLRHGAFVQHSPPTPHCPRAPTPQAGRHKPPPPLYLAC